MVRHSNGYEEQFQIYRAANATKEAVMILVFNTDPPCAEWIGTDAEMTRVNFAAPTQACFDARIVPQDICEGNVTDFQLYGEAVGACDTSPEAVKKIFSKAFRHVTIGDHIPEEFKSPAYEAAKSYQVSELSYREIYGLWMKRGTDKWGYDMRDAVFLHSRIPSPCCGGSREFQNDWMQSFQIAWDLLMEDRFEDLVSTICSTPKELQRFRQLVINSVMATDLGDKQLKELRNGRWEKAFANDETTSGSIRTSLTSVSVADSAWESMDVESGMESHELRINLKATIVIEHLIQAADVAHMSQHWHIYRKWNALLFREMYKAWREGRAENSPAAGWYKGEIGFFDFYIIPLSKKL